MISEFLAANASGLRDADGDRSDWIELLNQGASTVNLAGWKLSADPQAGTGWALPAVNLAPRAFLVVFASGKNRSTPGGELHTDFRLPREGGRLALMRPDQTLASDYAYPAQREDVAFGLSVLHQTNVLVTPASDGRFRVPTNTAIEFNWTGAAEPHDDSAAAGWRAGPVAVGYDTNSAGGGTRAESIGAPLIARATYDTAAGSIFVLSAAGFTQAGTLTDWELYSTTTLSITPLIVQLDGGGNYFIRGIGTTRQSNGRGAQTNLFGLVSGSARVGPGYYFGWKDGSVGGNNTGVPAFDQVTGAGIRWFQQHTSFTTNENLGAGQYFDRAYSLRANVGGSLVALAGTNVQGLMFGISPSLQLRAPFIVAAGPPLTDLFLRVTYDDGLVAWLNGVEIARRNAPAVLTATSASVTNRPPGEAGVAEDIDVSAFVGLLQPGTNILALQGLNDAVRSPEFLLRPELTGDRAIVSSNAFLDTPTPGTPNVSGWDGWVADTLVLPGRGFYSEPVMVTLTNPTPGAVLRYTLDGSEPVAGRGLVYTGPIRLTNTANLRVGATLAGYLPATIATHTYVFPRQVQSQPAAPAGFPAAWSGSAADYEVDPTVVTNTLPGYHLTNALLALPTVSLTADRADLFDASRGIYYNSASSGASWQRPASIEWVSPTGGDEFQADAVIRMAGDYSSGHGATPKHSIRVAFKSSAGPGKLRFPLFPDSPVTTFDQIELRACSTDSWPIEDPPNQSGDGSIRWNRIKATYLRDQFMRDTLRDMGQPTSHGRYVHLYLNGLYWGVYNLVEWLNDGWNEEHFGGDKSEYDVIKDYAELEEGNLQAWNEMMTLVNAGFPTDTEFQRLLGNFPDGRRNPAYPVYLHLGNFIDYMIAHIYCGAEDWPIHNWWASRRRGPLSEGFRFYVWDQEISNDSLTRTTTFASGPFATVSAVNTPAVIYDRLRQNTTFQQLFRDRVQQLLFGGGLLTPASNAARWGLRQAELDRAMVGESARWGDRRREPPYKREVEWLAEMNWQLNVYWPSNHLIAIQRFKSASLYPTLQPPVASHPGGLVPSGFNLALTHTNGAGSIYFTTDGSDPRLAGGSVSGAARSYLAPVPVVSPVFLRARVRSGTNWSAPFAASYFPPQDLSPLRLTEIMYHPPDFSGIDGDQFEFLELKNSGAVTLDLSGLILAGVAHIFTNGTRLAAGAFLVLVRDPAAFALKHPGVPFHGSYTGRLDNAGERLALTFPDGTPVLSVTYGDRSPWPVTPDGHGFSLVPTGNDNDPARADSWRASALPGGSPGADDPEPAHPRILINEVLSRPAAGGGDYIELLNAGPVDAAIGGWWLTDDAGVPRKFRLPPGTVIPAGGHLVVPEAEFNATPGTNGSFSLNPRGESVLLFSADAATNLTGYSHGFSFGAAATGESFGRHVLTTGEEEFPAQQAATPGLANTGPRVGPVVISEIHYHPDAGGDEFVELFNLGPDPVPLFDPAAPANAWQLAGLGFTFPTNLVLGAGQPVILVAIDPAVFRARHGIAAGVLVLGPYAGSLQDSGERLELLRPEWLDTNDLVAITVDAVRYNDRAPWPAEADGSGSSLQRHPPGMYGNDPAVWFAAAPTPGRLPTGGQAPIVTTPPAPVTVIAGETAVFTVVATGAGPLRFQWQKDGTAIAGATNTQLVLTGVGLADAGAYRVVVFNDAGSATSPAAVLSVQQAVTILEQPRSVVVRAGTNASFTVIALSFTPMSFQWRRNGIELPGAVEPTLALTNVQAADAGIYTVRVSDAHRSVVSEPATLQLLVDPVIVQQPLSQLVVTGGTVTLSVTVTNTATLPVGFRWRRGTVTVTNFVLNSRTAFLTITNVRAPQTNYNVVVTNAARVGINGITSSNAFLTLLPDSDGDRLPNAWELTHFGSATAAAPDADTDGDGMCNADEYTAGTDPNNPLSRLELAPLVLAPDPRLSFAALPFRTYSVQYRNDPATGAWTRLADFGARTNARTETVSDPRPGTTRIYRVATPRDP